MINFNNTKEISQLSTKDNEIINENIKKRIQIDKKITEIKNKLEKKGLIEGKDFMIKKFKNDKVFRVCFNFAVAAFNYTKEPNIVTLIRSAEIFGAKEVIIIGVMPRLTNKLTVGSKNWIDIKHFVDEKEAIDYIKSKYKLISFEIHKKAKPIFEIKKYPTNACFLIGTEKSSGVPEWIIKESDLVIRIPQFGISGSLNTATTASIAIYDYISKNISLDLLEVKGRNYKE